jgi:BMFP domain-containing protein YqiC
VPDRLDTWINDLPMLSCAGAPMWSRSGLGARYRSAIFVSFGGCRMSFLNSKSLDDLARRLAETVPESIRSLGRDLEGNFKAVLQGQLSKLDLVSRHEFDVQAALLARTQTTLSTLEARVKDLEAKLAPQ